MEQGPKRTRREVLELAALAAGVEIATWGVSGPLVDSPRDDVGFVLWNPLTDDGDAARVAAVLKMDVCWQNELVVSANEQFEEDVRDHHGNAAAAIRYAVTRAAAEIGAESTPQPTDGAAVQP